MNNWVIRALQDSASAAGSYVPEHVITATAGQHGFRSINGSRTSAFTTRSVDTTGIRTTIRFRQRGDRRTERDRDSLDVGAPQANTEDEPDRGRMKQFSAEDVAVDLPEFLVPDRVVAASTLEVSGSDSAVILCRTPEQLDDPGAAVAHRLDAEMPPTIDFAYPRRAATDAKSDDLSRSSQTPQHATTSTARHASRRRSAAPIRHLPRHALPSAEPDDRPTTDLVPHHAGNADPRRRARTIPRHAAVPTVASSTGRTTINGSETVVDRDARPVAGSPGPNGPPARIGVLARIGYLALLTSAGLFLLSRRRP